MREKWNAFPAQRRREVLIMVSSAILGMGAMAFPRGAWRVGDAAGVAATLLAGAAVGHRLRSDYPDPECSGDGGRKPDPPPVVPPGTRFGR